MRNLQLLTKVKRSAALVAITLAVSFLTGCATVNPEPFVKYRSAVTEAQTGIDAAMSVNYNWTRSGFIDGFGSAPNSQFSSLTIQHGNGYDWSLVNPPIYLDVKKTRAALAELNDAFATYADLLVQLAGGELVSTATFDQMAKDLNDNTKQAAQALNFNPPAQGVALFSTAASEAARLYIENRRQKHLKGAIEANQKNVAGYAKHCLKLVHIIRGSTKTYYDERLEPIKVAWNAGNAGSDKRLKSTEAALNLNEQFADIMRVLQELETAYTALPQAHADLAKAIEKPTFDVQGIQKLYASGKRLQKLYSELEKTESK